MQTQKWKNQYVMFDLQKLNNDIWYWENTLSSPEKIVDFINNLDKESLSYSRIPQWKTWTASDNDNVVYGANKMIWKDSRKNSTGNEKIDQYTLYIINSLEMAAEFCYERYMDDHNLDKNKYILDLSHNHQHELEYCGDSALTKQVFKIQPKFHCFGHIHDSDGCYNSGLLKLSDRPTIFINASCVTDGKFNQGCSSHGQIIEL